MYSMVINLEGQIGGLRCYFFFNFNVSTLLTFWESNFKNQGTNCNFSLAHQYCTLHQCRHPAISVISGYIHKWVNHDVTYVDVETGVHTNRIESRSVCNFIFPPFIYVLAISNRGLTEENTQLGIISPIGYFKSSIGCILANWGLVICSLTPRSRLIYPQYLIGYIIPNWGFEISNWGLYAQLGILSVSSLMSFALSLPKNKYKNIFTDGSRSRDSSLVVETTISAGEVHILVDFSFDFFSLFFVVVILYVVTLCDMSLSPATSSSTCGSRVWSKRAKNSSMKWSPSSPSNSSRMIMNILMHRWRLINIFFYIKTHQSRWNSWVGSGWFTIVSSVASASITNRRWRCTSW